MLLYGFVKVATWVAQKTPLLITRNVFVHNLSFPFLVFYVLPGRAKFCIWGQKWDTLNMVALLRKTVGGRLKDASTEEERLKRACTVHSAHAQCARTPSFDAEAHSLAKVAQGQTYWDAKTRRTFKSRWSTIGPSHFDMVQMRFCQVKNSIFPDQIMSQPVIQLQVKTNLDLPLGIPGGWLFLWVAFSSYALPALPMVRVALETSSRTSSDRS